MRSDFFGRLVVPLVAAVLILLGFSIYVFRNGQSPAPDGITPGIGGGPPASIMEPSATSRPSFTPTTSVSPIY